jgi:hypothetical protein
MGVPSSSGKTEMTLAWWYSVSRYHSAANHFLIYVRNHVARINAFIKAGLAQLDYASNVIPVLAEDAVSGLPKG